MATAGYAAAGGSLRIIRLHAGHSVRIGTVKVVALGGATGTKTVTTTVARTVTAPGGTTTSVVTRTVTAPGGATTVAGASAWLVAGRVSG
jgi:hypothetical protein